MHYFKYLGSKESARQLWENKEALNKYLAKLKELMEPNTFPRRNRLDLMKPAEKAIHDAMQEVEKLPADVGLTNAVIKLNEAKNLVSDFIDSLPSQETNDNEQDDPGGIEIPKKPPPPLQS